MLAMNVLDFTQDAGRISCSDQLVERLLRETRKVGLDLVSVQRAYTANDVMPLDPGHTRFPQEPADYDLDYGYVARRRAQHRARTTLLPLQWRDAWSKPMSPLEMAVREEAWSVGLKNGIVVPIHGPTDFSGLVSFAGPADDFAPEVLLGIQVMAFHFRHHLQHLQEDMLPPTEIGPRLTTREAECLAWLAQGKSDWDIGEIMSISHHTVKTHVDKIKRKLGVRTRVQAVVEGMRCGQINP